MAESAMIMFTVLAAGAALLATGTIVAKSRSGQDAEPEGNVISILGLCSKANRGHFERVLQGELDETPESEAAPGYHVVVMDIDDETIDGAARRFASAVKLVRQNDPRLHVGLVTDAQGLLFYAAHVRQALAAGVDATTPDFHICISPAVAVAADQARRNLKENTRPWACSPEDASVKKTQKLLDALTGAVSEAAAPASGPAAPTPSSSTDVPEAILTAAKGARIIQGIESPYHGCVDNAEGAVSVDVRGRGFLVYDVKRICDEEKPPEEQLGGAEPTPEELTAAREARRANTPPGERKPFFQTYRGEMLLGGLLKGSADYFVSQMDLTQAPELAGAVEGFDWAGEKAKQMIAR